MAKVFSRLDPLSPLWGLLEPAAGLFWFDGMPARRKLLNEDTDNDHPWDPALLNANRVGSEGADTLIAGAGDDTLSGLGGKDLLVGDAGDDWLDGGAGDDTLQGYSGADTLIGGEGFDVADYGPARDGVRVDLGAGTGHGGHAEGDRLSGIEGVNGGFGADQLLGNSVGNSLDGHGGDDLLTGGSESQEDADTLVGGDGADTLWGGAGDDTLVGFPPVATARNPTQRRGRRQVPDLTGGVHATQRGRRVGPGCCAAGRRGAAWLTTC